jgi:hypothetical protein
MLDFFLAIAASFLRDLLGVGRRRTRAHFEGELGVTTDL